jgi:hypothetical protein
MRLILGIFLICAGIGMGYLTYFSVVVRKKFTMTGGGFNLVAFASILFMTGLLMVMGY